MTHGPAGWLATGTGTTGAAASGAATTGAATPGAAASGTAVTGTGQHPVVLASPDGTAWRDMDGERAFAGTGGAAAQATWGPAGYVIVGSVTTGAGTFPAVWWSAGLRTWTRVAGPAQSGTAQSGPAQDGPGQMLGVAAGPAGYVAVGQLGVRPAVWTSADGRGWHAARLPAPRGAASAGLRRVAVSGAHVAALGEKQGLNGSQVPFAEVSADGGTTWQQVALPTPHGTAIVTAVTGARGGFTAVGTYGSPGNLDVILWTSADGTQWTAATPHGTGLSGPGVQEITGLDAMAGPGGTTRTASPATAPSQATAPSPAPAPSPAASSPGATASRHGAGGSAAGTGTASRRVSTSGGTVTGVGFTATQDAEQPTLWQFPARSLIPAR